MKNMGILLESELIIDGYLVAHPTNRKWVTTLVINGISGGNVHKNNWGVITHLLSGMNHQVTILDIWWLVA